MASIHTFFTENTRVVFHCMFEATRTMEGKTARVVEHGRQTPRGRMHTIVFEEKGHFLGVSPCELELAPDQGD